MTWASQGAGAGPYLLLGGHLAFPLLELTASLIGPTFKAFSHTEPKEKLRTHYWRKPEGSIPGTLRATLMNIRILELRTTESTLTGFAGCCTDGGGENGIYD